MSEAIGYVGDVDWAVVQVSCTTAQGSVAATLSVYVGGLEILLSMVVFWCLKVLKPY